MVRFKNRYMVVQLNTSEDILDFKIIDREIQSTVLNTIKLIHGDFGVGAIQTCFKVRHCNLTTKLVIFKTRHGPHKFLLSAIPFINKLNEKHIQLSTLYTGASVFQCHKFIQRIKTGLRSTLTQERLDNLGLLSIERDLTSSLNFDDIMNEFALKKSFKIVC